MKYIWLLIAALVMVPVLGCGDACDLTTAPEVSSPCENNDCDDDGDGERDSLDTSAHRQPKTKE